VQKIAQKCTETENSIQDSIFIKTQKITPTLIIMDGGLPKTLMTYFSLGRNNKILLQPKIWLDDREVYQVHLIL